jgi:hypothetical protein
VSLVATARARQRIARWRDLRAEVAQRAMAGMAPADPQALTGAVPALQRLAQRLETG